MKTDIISSILQARQLCQDQQMPVYGALLKNLMKRCDDEKNDKIR